MSNIKYKLVKVSEWDNGKCGVYQIQTNNLAVPFEYKKTKDKKGTLYCIDCSITGYFESYGIKEVTDKILKKLI